MGIFLNGKLIKAALLLESVGNRELYFYGFTLGRVGLGFVVSRKRKPIMHATDSDTATPTTEYTFQDDLIYSDSCTGAIPHRR
jgi:hypothetical protein